MKKIQRGTLLWGGVTLLGLISLPVTTAMADVDMTVSAQVISSLSEVVTTNMDFGTIDLDPDGDTITINASAGGLSTGGSSASPEATGTVTHVSGGTSGLLTIQSAIALDIDITYPGDTDVPLNGITPGLMVTDIDTNSGGGLLGAAAGTIHHTANIATLIHVGGLVDFPMGTETDNYSGTMHIELAYH